MEYVISSITPLLKTVLAAPPTAQITAVALVVAVVALVSMVSVVRALRIQTERMIWGDQAAGRAPPAGPVGRRPPGRWGECRFLPRHPAPWGWGGGGKNRSEYGFLLTPRNEATMRG